MSSAQTASDLAGLAVAASAIAMAWPAARKYFNRWTRPQKLKFFVSVLLCVAFSLAPIPVLNLLIPRNAAGRAPAGAALGAMVATLGWIFLGVLLLLRYLTDEPKPKWIKQFGIAYIVPVLIFAAGLGLVLAAR